MDAARTLRKPSVLLLLLLVGLLFSAATATAAGAQEGTDAKDDAKAQAAEEAKCQFQKKAAIEANGGPLGSAIWGRLCQVIDGKAAFPEGAVVTVSQDGAEVGSATTGPDGVFVVEIPGNGTYQVSLDPETLPKGFSLTNEKGATLAALSVKLGDQQAAFRLGEDTRGQRDFEDYATTVIKGVRLGLILAVAALGLSLVYGVTGLVNFAHAELVTFGALGTYVASKAMPFWIAIVVGGAVGAIAGLAQEKGIWAPLRRRRMALMSMMVVSIGLSILVRNTFQIAYGPGARRFDAARGQRERVWGFVRLTPNDVTIMLLCAVILVLVAVLLRRTRTGTAIRAVADNPDLAASSGIAVDRITAIVWMTCGALAAIGGAFYGLTVNVSFDMGFVLLLSMFAAVVLGGLGSPGGAVLGAIVIGVVQESSGLFIDTAYKFAVALGVLILVLLVRPQGLLGTKERFG